MAHRAIRMPRPMFFSGSRVSLGERGHAVEAEKRERGQRDAGGDEVSVDLAFLVNRVEDEGASAATAQNEVAAERDERDNGQRLDDEDDPVNAAAHLDAANIHECVKCDEHHGPQPCRAVGNQSGAPIHDHDDQQGRNQDVVQKNQPAGDEADMRVDAALHVGVYGARNGESTGHAHVAHGGEHDCHEADDVHQRRHTAAV